MDTIIFPGDGACYLMALFLFGIIAASLAWNYLAMAIVSVMIGAAFVLLKKGPASFIIFLCAAIIAGIFYYHCYLGIRGAQTKIPFGKNISLTGIIIDEPTPSATGILLTVAAQKPFAGTVLILAPSGNRYAYGDMVKTSGIAAAPDNAGDLPFMFSRSIVIIAHHQRSRLREVLIAIKLSILGKFNEILPADQAALLGGITFGSKENFTPQLKADMALAGLTHMVAISGYNITIIIISAGEIFGALFARRTTFILTGLFILLFILMSGIQASAIRAAIMGCVGLFSRHIGRSYDIRNSIVFTAAIMALQDPTILIYNAGFQLSFLSLIGVVYLQRPVKKFFHYIEPGFLQWKESACVTFSAQLGVMPVLIATFGQFSLTSIGANILVLGTVPLTMFFGFILVPIGFVSGQLAFFAGKIAGCFLAYQLWVIKLFAEIAVPLPIALNSSLAIILYYLFIIIFAFAYGDRVEGI